MPKAKLAVGKMQRVKPGEVVTGYQVNKNGTTTLLIEKKNRAANPKKHKLTKKLYEIQMKSRMGHWENDIGGSGENEFTSKRLANSAISDLVKIYRRDGAKRSDYRIAVIPGAKNPSIRKSKKTFKKFAKRLGVSLKKKLPRSLTHSKSTRNSRTISKRSTSGYSRRMTNPHSSTGWKATIQEDANSPKITLRLYKDADAYRWYEGSNDAEVSGSTISEAKERARSAWRSWKIKISKS